MGASKGGSDVEVFVWGWGVVPSSVTIGYLHCGKLSEEYPYREPACLEQKETGAAKYGDSSPFGYRYKKLTGDWYILEQSN